MKIISAVQTEVDPQTKLLDALTSGRDVSGHRYLEISAEKSHKGPQGLVKLRYSVRYGLIRGSTPTQVTLVALSMSLPVNSNELKRAFFNTTVKRRIADLLIKAGYVQNFVVLSPYSHSVNQNKGVVSIK